MGRMNNGEIYEQYKIQIFYLHIPHIPTYTTHIGYVSTHYNNITKYQKYTICSKINSAQL